MGVDDVNDGCSERGRLSCYVRLVGTSATFAAGFGPRLILRSGASWMTLSVGIGCDRVVARRVRMPSSGVESWTVVGPAGRAVEEVDEFLGWLTGIERSPARSRRMPGILACSGRSSAGVGWRGIGSRW